MADHQVVTREEWLSARKRLLAKEKEFTHLKDDLSRRRRALPWVRVEKPYAFDTPTGKKTLAQLFEGTQQLLMQHFMLGPGWGEGCPACSFWADNFDGIDIHLKHRDVTFLVVSRAPLAEIEAYKKRMGWHFPWVSSFGSDFNFDYGVSFTPEALKQGKVSYNYAEKDDLGEEMPGVSAFFKDDAGAVFHTYSCYERGLDQLNGAYQYLDLTAKGRDEDGLPYPTAWLRRHDAYEVSTSLAGKT
ncbi:MAG TPA: DUF899 domain-containing protein [Candidatus Baltobacteraceae bacterium]|jgi:predicted dithiol-disulfide oxidoreductase (DUF899 family)|nr:DUF899 domain-containing protein [Candidatus Baltobacteraceae bacterium]